MQFHVLTLFTEMIENGCDNSILKRAMAKKLIGVSAVNVRDFTLEKHGKVDDYTYGGGAGMLIQAQPVYDAWKSLQKRGEEGKRIRTVYVTPKGKTFTQSMAKEFAKEEELIILCGHYEGIDERALEEIVTDRVSIGDFVLTGGELPAMVMIDAISRLIPGVLGSEESAQTETFENDLLEYPQYSRPEVWHGKPVPQVLLSGDHKKILKWRQEESERLTRELRPDLYEKYEQRQKTIQSLLKHKKENAYLIDGLMRGTARLLYAEGDQAIGVDVNTGTVMLCCDDPETGKRLMKWAPAGQPVLLHNCAALIDYLQGELGYGEMDECYQSVYTQKNALPVAHKDVRPFPPEMLDYAAENYGREAKEYLQERIRSGAFFAAFEDGELAGFCGIHMGGSLGLLFVDPKYRRTSVGSSLASYLVNKALERGGLPYAHIRVKNEASLKMQQKMGLYVGKKTVFWTKKDLQS